MDFTYTEEQAALGELAEQIIADKIDHAALRALEAEGGRIHEPTWASLAEAGVLAALLPESAGGAGVGLCGIGAVLEVIGKHAAPVPVHTAIVLGGLPIAEFGTPDQQALLPRIGAGELLVTSALAPTGSHNAGVTVSDDKLSGTANWVPSGLDAHMALIPAGDGVYLVDLSADGVTVEEVAVTSGRSEGRIVLDGAAAELLGGSPNAEVQVPWMTLRAEAGICAISTGMCEGSLALLGAYANERQQFNRVIASFQAVSQRAGDSYIDTEAVRLTARSAAFHLDAGLDATPKVAIARWWAAEAGHRVVHAATHIHGGVGVDRDYPLHRHFLMSRQLGLTLGNSEQQLERLGDLIAH